jgi:hypothetical protein
MSDNGKSDDRKRRQNFSSMYHGILLIHRPVADVAARKRSMALTPGLSSNLRITPR